MKSVFIFIMGGVMVLMLHACQKPIETTTQTTPNTTTNETTEMTTNQTTQTTTTQTTTSQLEELYYADHTIIHRVADFNKGDLNDVTLAQEGVILEEGVLTGSYTSPIINTESFKQLVSSWNAITPTTSYVELKIQIRQNNTWSKWFTYGKWGIGKANASVASQTDVWARMSIDTLIVKSGSADGYRYMVKLNRQALEDESPTLKLISATLALNEPTTETIDLSQLNWQNDIEVPIHSQMLVPVIGNVICSPTSLTMLMNHYGIHYTPNETAQVAKDYGANIYGNWSYNVAVAGALGLEAYVSRLESIDELKRLISENVPVAVSITVKEATQLDNLPLKSDGVNVMTYPGGHLLVVRGFTVKDNVEYVIVNDPAARNNDEVNRLYKLEQFETIWKNYVYIVKNPIID